MAWQIPKTNWSSADGVRDSDMNRIEGNILELRSYDAHADIYVYVNASSGNDSTGNGTAAYPFRTITKALNSIPRNLNGKDAVVSIAAGSYQESVTIRGFDAPVVLMSSGTVYVAGFRVDGCHCSLNGGIEIYVNNAAAYVVNCGTLTGAGSLHVDGAHVQASYGSTISLDSITCDNSPSFTIIADGNSRIHGMYLDGNNNEAGLSAQGGSVVSYGDINMEINSTIYFTAMGGRIYSGAQTVAPNY